MKYVNDYYQPSNEPHVENLALHGSKRQKQEDDGEKKKHRERKNRSQMYNNEKGYISNRIINSNFWLIANQIEAENEKILSH